MGGGTTPVHCSCDKLVSLEKICPNPQNPNKHSEQQIELLAKIIKEQGWRQPVKVSNRSGYIVSGHGRYLAAELIACEASGRCCRAIELDPQFCDVIVKRYIEVTGKKDIYLSRNGKKIAYDDIENRS